MWRTASRSLVALLAGLVAATLVVEIGLRVILATPLRNVLPVPQIPLFGPDADTGYRHRAHVGGFWLTEHRAFVRTSNLGLRDRDRDPAHGRGPRAIVVGDSFIEAAQVDWPDTGVAVAERIVARDIPGAEVVNLGLANARPAQLVARLQSQGLALAPDLAVIVLSMDRLLANEIDDSEFTAYRPGADGELHLSYGFRSGRGYRLRSGPAGAVFYWLLDHSQVMRVLNARKNIGWLAEWWQPVTAAAPAKVPSCPADLFTADIALWVDGVPAVARGQRDAFLRDVAAVARSNRLPITIAVRGVETRCRALTAERDTLIAAVRARVEAAGLQFADMEARILAKVGPDGVAPLYGFGAGLGDGHLNVAGNRVYGEILAELIGATLH